MVTEMREDLFSLVVRDSSDQVCARMGRLQHLRKNRTFCDVVLQVESCEIFAHRCVLACASPYFLELFTADDESRTATEDKLIYKLNGVFEKDPVERLVAYAYTGHMDVPKGMEKALYLAANKLKMDEIASLCGAQLVSSLSPESCLSIRALPGIAANADLAKEIDEYIRQQDDLSQVTKEALSSASVPRILLQVILDLDIKGDFPPAVLCQMALEWMRAQVEKDGITMAELAQMHHLLYLSDDKRSLRDCSDLESGAVNDSDLVQDYKKKSRKTTPQMLKLRRGGSGGSNGVPLSGVFSAPPRGNRGVLFSRSIEDEAPPPADPEAKVIAFEELGENCIVAIASLNGSVSVVSIQLSLPTGDAPPSPSSRSPVSESYSLLPPMSSPKCATGVGVVGGKLLVCGGYDRGECLPGVEEYDPGTQLWADMPPMLQSRGRFDLTVVGGKAFAVGGCNGSKELDSVEVFDEEQWRWAAPLPLARSNTGVCSLDNDVFCIGGWNGQFGIRQCDQYDTKTDVWTTIAPLHTGRYQAGVASFCGRVWAVGGCDSWHCLNSVEVLDPAVGEWRGAPPITTPRRGCGLAVLEGKLYVIGGSDGTQSLSSTEVFDPKTNTWTAGPPMMQPRANVGVAVLGGSMYAVGGFSGKHFLNTIEVLDSVTGEWNNCVSERSLLPLVEETNVHLNYENGSEDTVKTDSSCKLDVLRNGTSYCENTISLVQ